MPKNYCIDIFHYEGHNLWHTRYMSMFVFLFADPRNTPLPQLKQALCELSKVFSKSLILFWLTSTYIYRINRECYRCLSSREGVRSKNLLVFVAFGLPSSGLMVLLGIIQIMCSKLPYTIPLDGRTNVTIHCQFSAWGRKYL